MSGVPPALSVTATALAALKGLALANVCFANLWYHVLDARPARYYALHGPASRARLWAALANVVCLGLAIAVVLEYGRLTGDAGTSAWAGVAAVVALGLTIVLQVVVLFRTAHDRLRSVRRAVRFALGTPTRRLVARAVALAGVVVMGAWSLGHPAPRLVWGAADALAYAVLPLLPIVFGRTLWYAWQGHPVARDARERARAVAVGGVTPHGGAPPEPPDGHRTAVSETPSPHIGNPRYADRRVVWVVFDELDYGLAFDRRPRGVSLPHFDALAADALVCTQAVPPAHCTELAMPALISGLRVAGTWPESSRELSIAIRKPGQETFDAEDPRLTRVRWSAQETVFSRARALGKRSAMVGWFHPYARVIGAHLASCEWHEAPEPAFAARASFAGAFVDHFRGLLETGRYSVFGPSLSVRKAAAQHRAVRARAMALAGDAAYDLVLVHWPIPHSPFFHDARRDRNDAANRGPAGYVDNLILTDRMLGELRAALAATPAGRGSTLIVTSDHWWRASAAFDGVIDRRVPFIVRLPDGGPARCDARVETVITHDLILAHLRGEVTDVGALVAWLEATGSAPPTATVARM